MWKRIPGSRISCIQTCFRVHTSHWCAQLQFCLAKCEPRWQKAKSQSQSQKPKAKAKNQKLKSPKPNERQKPYAHSQKPNTQKPTAKSPKLKAQSPKPKAQSRLDCGRVRASLPRSCTSLCCACGCASPRGFNTACGYPVPSCGDWRRNAFARGIGIDLGHMSLMSSGRGVLRLARRHASATHKEVPRACGHACFCSYPQLARLAVGPKPA